MFPGKPMYILSARSANRTLFKDSVCGRQNNDPPNVHILNPEPMKMLPYMAQGILQMWLI